MEISSNNFNTQSTQNQSKIKTNFTQKLSQEDLKDIKDEITQRANDMMLDSVSVQTSLSDLLDDAQKVYDDFKNFLNDIGYDGKPIADLSEDEASELIGEDGFFGIEQTSTRIANFVIDGANEDESLMRAGRDGILQGFKDAEEMWGSELPEISQKTIQAAIEKVDKAMYDLGFSILDTEV